MGYCTKKIAIYNKKLEIIFKKELLISFLIFIIYFNISDKRLPWVQLFQVLDQHKHFLMNLVIFVILLYNLGSF